LKIFQNIQHQIYGLVEFNDIDRKEKEGLHCLLKILKRRDIELESLMYFRHESSLIDDLVIILTFVF
jgi:hypothetical protein